MATKREQFQELRRGGMDAVTAQNKVYGEMPKTVSATVTPAVANIGGEAPKVMETPTLPPETAPVVPKIDSAVPPQRDITKESIFTPPPTVEPAKIETLGEKNLRQQSEFAKTSPAKDFMTDIERRNAFGQVDQQKSKDQMIANVGIMAKEDPATLSDRAKFNAKTGYDTKPEPEKAILDQYFTANTPKTSQDIQRQLASGVNISDPAIVNTPAFRQAKFENDRINRYSGMSSEQLFTEMKTGLPSSIANTLKGTPAYNEAMAKYDQYKKVDNINRSSEFLATGKSKEVDPLAQLSNQLSAIYSQEDQTGSTAEAYKAYISQNPEITEPTKEYNIKMGQRKELERARESLVEDLKKKYAGEPLSTIMAIASREAKPMNDQINTLNDSLATIGADIKYKTDLATQEFGFYQADQQAKTAKQQKLQDLLGGLAVSQYGKQQDQAFDMQKLEVQQKYQADRDTQNYLQDLQKMGVANVYDLQKLGANQNFQKELLSLNQKYENSRSVRDFQNDIQKMGFQFELGQKSKAIDLSDQKSILEYKASLDPELAEKWEAVREKAKENTTLETLWGSNKGTYKDNRGHDLAGKLGDAIVAPPGARVVEVRSLNDDGTVSMAKEGQGAMSTKDVGYGNSVVLQLPDGKYMRLSHLNSIDVPLGSELAGGQMIGTRGNTGNVKGKNGETLTPEQKAAGRGAHVDVEISLDDTFKGKSLLPESEQILYLRGIKPFAQAKGAKTELNQLAEYLIDTQPRGPGFSDADAKAFTDSITKYANAGDDQTVYQLFRNKLMENKRVSEDVNDNASLLTGLGNLKGLLTEYKESGDETGIVTRLAETVARATGRTTDDTLAKAENQLGVLVADYIRAISGTAASDTEVARLLGNMPNIKNIDSLNMTILNNLESIARNRVDSTLKTQLGFKKDLASKIFPEFYQKKAGMSTIDEDYLKSLGY